MSVLESTRPAVIAAVRPGDTLIIAIPGHATAKELDELTERINRYARGVRVILLDSVTDLQVVRPSAPDDAEEIRP